MDQSQEAIGLPSCVHCEEGGESPYGYPVQNIYLITGMALGLI
jgi:hypothetical protein